LKRRSYASIWTILCSGRPARDLRALRDAGLLTSARHGRSVLYLRSELGDALIAGVPY
jgi:hypothetical protein